MKMLFRNKSLLLLVFSYGDFSVGILRCFCYEHKAIYLPSWNTGEPPMRHHSEYHCSLGDHWDGAVDRIPPWDTGSDTEFE